MSNKNVILALLISSFSLVSVAAEARMEHEFFLQQKLQEQKMKEAETRQRELISRPSKRTEPERKPCSIQQEVDEKVIC